MKKNNVNLSCNSCVHSRRAFLASCAKCIGAAGVLSGFVVPELLTSCQPASRTRMKVRVVFVLTEPVLTTHDWAPPGYDFNPVMENIMSVLSSGCPGIEFVQSMVANGNEADKLKDADNAKGDIEGYVVVQMTCWNQAVEQLAESGKPVLYADYLYAGSGGFLRFVSKLIYNKAENFAYISSMNYEHLAAAANCMILAKVKGGNRAFVDAVAKLRVGIASGVKVDMTCMDDKFDTLSIDDLRKELKTKRILEFENGWADIIPETKESLGIEIVRRPFAELNDLWEKADRNHAMEYVRKWKYNAEAIVDVSDDTLEESARMYLAMKACLNNHDACGITINCLGGFYGGLIQAYPCLGFHELLNEGLIGACECDTISTITMVATTTLTKGRPGYISDPVMDLATKQIIYAHCVASNKVFGPGGVSNPYTIMTHSEDRQGASLRSTLPLGYMTTTLEMHPGRKEILFHQAKTVANSLVDRACRTKIAGVPVGDFEKLYKEWSPWGWHRVTYYGDLKEPIYALADAVGWKVVEEA